MERRRADIIAEELEEQIFSGAYADGDRLDEVRLGPLVDRNVRAVVNDGDLFGSLLGMGYLDRFRSIEIRGDELILTR